MPSLQIELWAQAHFTPGTQSHAQYCAWGGSSCTTAAEFTVTDRAGTRFGACGDHTLSYIRDRLEHGD